MYYSYIEIEYVATNFSPARTDLALKLLTATMSNLNVPSDITKEDQMGVYIDEID
jgi:hypothetical protein